MSSDVFLLGRPGPGQVVLLALVVLLVRPCPASGDDPPADPRAALRSPDKWTRAKAVEALALVGNVETWKLVIGALADPKGEVADAAQLALATLEGPKAVELLAGEGGLRSKDALVRARVAEALGRLPLAPPPRLLERALEDPDAEVRRMAAWSLERLAETQKLEEAGRAAVAEECLRSARTERDPLVRVRALAAVCTVDPEHAPLALDEARRHKDPLVRGAAGLLFARAFEPGAALERLAPLAVDPAPSVRRLAAEGLAGLRTRAAALLLAERLAAESEERLVLREVELLQDLSGLKHRRDPRPWADWARRLPQDWDGIPVSAAATPEAHGERTVAVFAGLKVVSRRVTFLIDLSGSIWNERPDKRTRKEIVDQKLREALLALPPDTRFNLIPYTGEPIPWKERLVEATPARVREAAAWFEARREHGSGNFWDAALLALADPDVDTLLVLFDGAPTGGRRHRLELIVPLFLERNFARRVAVDLVLVDASQKLQRMWGELAAGTGGKLVAVSF